MMNSATHVINFETQYNDKQLVKLPDTRDFRKMGFYLLVGKYIMYLALFEYWNSQWRNLNFKAVQFSSTFLGFWRLCFVKKVVSLLFNFYLPCKYYYGNVAVGPLKVLCTTSRYINRCNVIFIYLRIFLNIGSDNNITLIR